MGEGMHKVLLSLFLAAQLGSIANAAARPRKGGKAAAAATSKAKAKIAASAKGKIAAKPKVKRFKLVQNGDGPPTLENPRGYEGNPHVMSAGRSELPKILFLHGLGQPTNNELIGRVVGALRQEGVQNDVVSLPWEADRPTFEKWIKAQPGSFILSGHSAGGAHARDLAESYPDKFKALFLINPATPIRALKVPTLLVRGTEDYITAREGGENVTVLNPLHADHSLRYHPGRTTGFQLMAFKKAVTKQINKAKKAGRDEEVASLQLELEGLRPTEKLFLNYAKMEKAEIAQLPDTERMNREVAGEIEKFLGKNGIAH
jgi:predicted alpha/beta-hydrolase family hydrolase